MALKFQLLGLFAGQRTNWYARITMRIVIMSYRTQSGTKLRL